MRTRLLVAPLVGIALATLARAQTPVFGPEFQVNATTTSYQYSAAVANVGPSCNFVVVWTADGQDGSHTGIEGRLFDSAGAPTGGEFAVNVSTTGYQLVPRVASNAAGNFVVTWSEYVPGSGLSAEVRARRFDASGAPQGGDIIINTYTTGEQSLSSAAMDSAGNFVVVWDSGPDYGTAQTGQDGSDFGVFGRRYDANGNPLSAEFQVNEYTTGEQSLPRIAMNPAGDFIVVWMSPQDAQNGAIMARRYDANGTPISGEFQVNTTEV